MLGRRWTFPILPLFILGAQMTTPRKILAWDTETFPINQASQLPRVVTLALGSDDGTIPPTAIGNDDFSGLRDHFINILEDREYLHVGQFLSYDLGIVYSNFPDLLPLIFKALDDETLSDTAIREKLLNLTITGDLENLRLPDGSSSRLTYGMEALVKKYFGIDISATKSDPAAWRTNFEVFDNVPIEQYPKDAVDYVLDDVNYPLKIWRLQEDRRQEIIAQRGIDPFATESFRILVDFVLRLMSARGVATDPIAVQKVEDLLAKELAPDKLDLLFSTGILRPAEPPRPYKNGAKDHQAGCLDPKMCQCPPKLAEGKPESVDNTVLKEYVWNWATTICEACKGNGVTPSAQVPGVFIGCTACTARGRIPREDITLAYTDPTDKFPKGQLSCTSDFFAEHAGLLDPVLKQFQHRAKLQKLVTTEIPRMKLDGVVQPVVYPQFDCLKETGRTSSFASKGTKEKPSLAATFNCQNVDPRVRNCYVPRPGMLLWSSDFSQMELGTLAQRCITLFGYSTLANKINAGVDVHAYTGAQLAYAMDEEFRKLCITIHGQPSPEQIYQIFLDHKDHIGDPSFYKHWRKFAKPVNLGYPGGLGPKTFVTYAASEQYGVEVTREEAAILRDLWKQTYPEMNDYFAYINKKCIDPWNKGWDEKNKQEYDLYCYDSPFGLHRAGCDYCACANGLGLQTHSADGALLAGINIMKACMLPGENAILGPVNGQQVVFPLMFIHDEYVGEMPDDELAHERCMEIRRLMIEAMAVVTPDVRPNANVCLMRRWDKYAEPVFDSAGRLNVWTPKQA